MATIKSYTDLEQSKKLAEILPLESADMGWYYNSNPNSARNQMWVGTKAENADIPCWSLASLLGVLSMIRKGKDIANPFISKTPDNEYYVVYATFTEEVDVSAMCDNPVDACYDIITYLHEREHKLADKIEPKFRIGDVIEVKPMKCHGKIFTGKINKIVDITEKSYILDDGKAYNIELQDGWKLSEQEPAWSEEDEKEVAILEAYIRTKDWSDRHIDRALGIVDALVNKVKSLNII